MSGGVPTIEKRSHDGSSAVHLSSPQPLRPQRVLACVLCQQRKVKCDRQFPCANCIKSRARCVLSALTPRRRRRRFPERELLGRLRKYEDLLLQNNVKFEPLHQDPAREEESQIEGSKELDNEQPEAMEGTYPSPSRTIKSESVYEAKNIWHAMSHGFRDPENESDSSGDDIREAVFDKAWDQILENNDHFLLGSRRTTVDVSTLHPNPVQIFRLWQIYLDNVNPLLKVTYTPVLQGRIIEAASNVTNISPTLEALIFSIYCMSTLSLNVDDCQTMFGSSKDHLMTRFQFGCQQALMNCGILRCRDRDSLTAFYLYLMSVRSSTDPQSLSSMLGVAIRIAQRQGIHSESANADCTAHEAEMRRRLWWSLVLFDARISEMAHYKSTTLVPTWDCKVPLNMSDSDLRPEMKEPPLVQGRSSEAIFAVVRSELGEFVRNTMFYLDFTNPVLKPIANNAHYGPLLEGSEAATLEKMIEDKYLTLCDPENPLHFMTIWTTRIYLAKCRLLEHYSKHSDSLVQQTDAERDAAVSHALSLLESDTKLTTSPHSKKYLWLIHMYFPFPVYIHIIQDLRRRPVSKLADRAWDVMSDSYEARFGFPCPEHNPFYVLFTKLILQAWDAREAVFKRLAESLEPPRIVSYVRHEVAQFGRKSDPEQPKADVDMGIHNFMMAMPMGFTSDNKQGSTFEQVYPAEPRLVGQPNLQVQSFLDFDASQLDFPKMDWGLGELRGW